MLQRHGTLRHTGYPCTVRHPMHYCYMSLHAQVLSTVFFIAVLGGAAYLWLKLSGKDDSGDDGGNDALADAKRIMDKYR